jgi:hypothetical protein
MANNLEGYWGAPDDDDDNNRRILDTAARVRKLRIKEVEESIRHHQWALRNLKGMLIEELAKHPRDENRITELETFIKLREDILNDYYLELMDLRAA